MRGLVPLLLLVACAAIAVPASGAGSDRAKPPAKLADAHAAQARAIAAREEGDDPALEEEEREEVLERGEFLSMVSSAPAVSVPAAALAAGQQQAGALSVAGGSWDEVTDKPFLDDPVNRGFNYGVGWFWVTGRMTALTSSGRAVYAGAADGGVWRTTDRGRTWTPLGRGLPRTAVGALATNPRDGSVWVGLGEANTSTDAQAAFGIYRLARGASTWHRVGGAEAMSRAVYYLKFINGWAYAATQQGLLRRPAADLDARWQVALKPDPNPTDSPYRTSHITDVVAVPGTGGSRVLAALGWRGFTAPGDTAYNGFYVSDAGGTPGSFHRITPKGRINPETLGRTTFSTSGGRIYAVVEDTSTLSLLGQGAYVSRSGDPAGPWRRIANPWKLANKTDTAQDPPPGYFPGIQAWYNQYIKADPRDPDHLYLGLEELYESTNGGVTWTTIGPYWNYGISCNPDGDTPYACPPTTHPDQHAIAFVGRSVYVGNDGGVWRRSMSERGRGGWTNLNRDLHTLQYYSAGVGRVGDRGNAYWGGLQDNGETLLLPWKRRLEQAFTGDGGDTIVDPGNGLKAVVEYTNFDTYLTTDGAVTLREASPSCLTATFPPDPCDPNPLFISPIEADAHDIDHWVGGGQFIWKTTRGWNTVCEGEASGNPNRCDWKIQYDLGAPHQASSVDLSGETIYAGWCGPCNPQTGEPFARGIATNAGGTWHQLDVSDLPNRYVTQVWIDPGDDRHVLALFGSYSRRWIDGAGFGHVWESTNAGASWRDISGNLPDVPAHDVEAFAGGYAVATDVGVFWSEAGTSWVRLGRGLPPTRVWDLTTTPGGGKLVAGTHGRGQWEIGRP